LHGGERSDEVALLDLAVTLVRRLRLIGLVVLTCLVLGLAYALAATPEYTTASRLVIEASEGQRSTGGLSALRGLGITLGASSSAGLSPQAYPSLLTSREVRLAVARDTFFVADLDTTLTYVDYVNRPATGLEALVNAIKRNTVGRLRRLLTSPPPFAPVRVGDAPDEFYYPTRAEEKALQSIKKLVGASLDEETGLLIVSVTATEPVFAAKLAESFIEHLSARVRTIRTKKARQNLAFVRTRFESAERELMQAEEGLARFLDRNTGISSAQLRVEEERLERRVRFKRDLYSDMQAQMAQAEIELQRSEPAVTVVEAPVPPPQRSAPQRTIIVLFSLVVGAVLGVAGAFVQAALDGEHHDRETREKVEEIRNAFDPLTRRVASLHRRVRSALGGEDDRGGEDAAASRPHEAPVSEPQAES
jgi:uncharacterized protein involved in exopolysaccharide biosynthesis